MPRAEFNDHGTGTQCNRLHHASGGNQCTRPLGHEGAHESARQQRTSDGGTAFNVYTYGNSLPCRWEKTKSEIRAILVYDVDLQSTHGTREQLFVSSKDNTMEKAFIKAMKYAKDLDIPVSQIVIKKTTRSLI